MMFTSDYHWKTDFYCYENGCPLCTRWWEKRWFMNLLIDGNHLVQSFLKRKKEESQKTIHLIKRIFNFRFSQPFVDHNDLQKFHRLKLRRKINYIAWMGSFCCPANFSRVKFLHSHRTLSTLSHIKLDDVAVVYCGLTNQHKNAKGNELWIVYKYLAAKRLSSLHSEN